MEWGAGLKEKTCSKCGLSLPVDLFLIETRLKSGLSSWCRPCKRKVRNAFRSTPEGKQETKKYNDRRKLRPGVLEKDNRSRVAWSHGINRAEYDEIFESQNGFCGCCKCDITGKDAQGRRKAALDHNHSSGRLRGFLCPSCNLALGCVQDSSERLRKLIDYLERTKDSE